MFDISREHGMEEATHEERLDVQQKLDDVWTRVAASVGGRIGVRAPKPSSVSAPGCALPLTCKASSPVGLLVS